MFGIKKKTPPVMAKNELNELKAYIDSHKSTVPPKSNGNGHKPAAEIPAKEVVNAKDTGKRKKKTAIPESAITATVENPIPVEDKQERKKADLEREQAIMDAEEEKQQEKAISGFGVLIGTKKKFLPEATIIDKGQALTFALGYMQEDMLNPDRTESLFDLFAYRMMQLQKSVDGKNLDQYILARQQDADKNATMNAKADLFGTR